MNEPITSDERFKGDYMERMRIGDFDCFIGSDRKCLYLGDEPSITIDDARDLRDWLNKVLP